ncbi:MAG: SUMF1/EgtB/PvdO family nonheme iron enzyme [Rhodospirillales bacterium]|nr:SUMF1/EgtB/PvdO family nonheme iron enzyme [Rhodospirillales bacterium]
MPRKNSAAVSIVLSAALEDPDCPLFVISTVRSDFLNHVEILPRLVSARNEIGRSWTLAPMGTQALREVVDGPARLAALEVGEIRDWIVSESEGEPGALPLVENALAWLWETRSGNRLSGQQFRSAGGIAGILVRSADDLLASMDDAHRTQALELLFRLVKVDSEGYRHARRRLPFAQAVEACGGGEEGRGLLYRLAGGRGRGDGMGGNGVRLITVTEDTSSSDVEVAPADQRDGRAVSLIHETLIRSKDADGKPQPYWPTLWNYIEKNKERATWRERLREDVATWVAKGRSPGLQWSLERVREAAKALRPVIPELSRDEREFLGSIDPRAMVAELQRSETTHMRRLIIGERLDVLGDPRPGVASGAQGLPDIAWCEVEGRTLTIDFRRNPNDPCSAIIGSLARSVRPFRISRYPITVAQYRAFVEANDGWDDPASWSGGLYRDPEGRSYHFGRFGNSPATYVSWFDAVAFCRWLSRRSALTIRLPDEWEWQQAATGGDIKNLYPWGAGWIQIREPYRANILESGLGGATAVGMYPDGASPAGALDMAGTVWEWCIDEHDFPGAVSSQDLDRYDASETTGPGFNRMVARVLRGGSWFDLQDFARSKFRFRSMPTNRNATIGFRVVCSSTFSPIDH